MSKDLPLVVFSGLSESQRDVTGDFEAEARRRDDTFRRAAFARVERELRELGVHVDIRVRRTSVTIEAIDWVTGPTLLEAVDLLRARNK